MTDMRYVGVLPILMAGAMLVLPLEGVAVEPLTVVQFASFDCPACAKAEACHDTIKSAVEQKGGRFVFAPIPTAGQDGGREALYYASRYSSELEKHVRKTLFLSQLVSASSSAPKVHTLHGAREWLAMQSEYPYWQELTEVAITDGAAAVKRALTLAAEAGVRSVPAYVNVKAGVPNLLYQGSPESCSQIVELIKGVAK